MTTPTQEIDAAKSSSRSRLWPLIFVIFLVAAFFIVQKLLQTTSSIRNSRYKESAVAASEAKDWVLLEQIAERWTDEDPKSGSGWLALAEAYQRQSKPEDAQQAYSQVPHSDDRYLQAMTARAELLYFELNRPREAVEIWKQMLELEPAATSARQGLISYYALSLQRAKMIDEIRRAMQAGGEPIEAYVYLFTADRLSFSDAAFRVDQWLQKDSDNEDALVAKAYYLARHGNSQSVAEREFNSMFQGDWTMMKQVAKQFPDNLNVLSFQIENAIFAGDTEEVLSLLNCVPNSAEADARFWRYRGWLLMQSEATGQANESFKKCFDANPYDWRARLLYSESLRKSAQNELADKQANLAEAGKNLEKMLLSLDNPTALEPIHVDEMLSFAVAIGDDTVVESLHKRGAIQETQ